MAKLALKPVVVDLARLAGSANAAAYARAAALHTSMGFEKFDANAVVNFLAQALTSEPGLPVVKQDYKAIDADRRTFAAKYLREAVSAGSGGVTALTAYLNQMDHERRVNLVRVNAVFNGAANISGEIEARLTFAMHTLTVVKFGATVALAVIPLAPIFVAGVELSATASLVISLGYGLGQTAIKDHHNAAAPNVVAFDVAGESPGRRATARSKSESAPRPAASQPTAVCSSTRSARSKRSANVLRAISARARAPSWLAGWTAPKPRPSKRPGRWEQRPSPKPYWARFPSCLRRSTSTRPIRMRAPNGNSSAHFDVVRWRARHVSAG